MTTKPQREFEDFTTDIGKECDYEGRLFTH